MPDSSFADLLAQIQRHFQDQTYADGLETLDRQAASFPEHIALLSLWRMSLLAGLGEIDGASQVLERALQGGVWYAESLLRESAALETLQGQPEFERLVDISRQMQAADPANALPLIVVHPEGRCAEGDDACPLLLFLHGNQETVQDHLPHLRAAPELGWLLALPQSQQAMWAGAYTWTDHAASADEVEAHFRKLSLQYAVDAERVVLAGRGMGAEVALWMALQARLPATGLVLLSPSGPLTAQPERWEQLISAARNRSLRAAIFAGEEGDEDARKNVDWLSQALSAAGFACRLEALPASPGAYPPDFETALRNSLDFILNQNDNP